MRHGLTLARPWGESNGYDFVVDCGPQSMVRVQVKSTMFREGRVAQLLKSLAQ
jgi:hypothetical protein